ncbi:prepilin-type N-terminal cleavage/methylation domain-containing protein [Clostridium gasigenes]|uniref:Type IV pilus assembly protein PilA n=1 Tax=Clostridium gasigenes TaxID=94869 RepID=A0A1H0STN5_9CLOT|nr:prepilin-type N-terminal cleavage/methylation domain-containing protein [Clostridium gasigenes]MBB6623421.1 prepilin-type N-terminal cleavage/methylation domain-containing protein [Clostridium gasigenes]MBU3089686.1 prepilin-type N-terminal cleavage/methylation domain-containing protein [Clostridium gasigenes]MBU3104713.1 prepilin-type N-terminal cleavage/methylation domain-containing protein [Clostridium gasigenes]MBU3108503.1 prepilin-type N-terminal cleavage/methylation domain-containing 
MIKNLNKKKKSKGFTLIELIIVIAIIAILAAIAIPKFGEVKKNANLKADIANAKSIANSVSSLISDDKIVPITGGIISQVGPTANAAGDKAAPLIEDYLQSVSAPKSKLPAGTEITDYTVAISEKGDITVYLANVTNQLFPKQATALVD